jgi:heat shock protein HslJ
MKRIIMLALFALVAAACGAGSGQIGSDQTPSVEGAWQLESGTLDGAPVPMVDTHPITLTVEGDRVSGTAACNGYGGELQISGDRFSIANLAATEMACFPPETMDSEQAFLEALIDVDSAEVTSGRLILRGSRSELVFTALAPVPEAELTNTVWVLESIVEGDAVSSVSGERATLELFSDGSFIGSTGCRTLAGSYVISGAEVQFTSFGASGECPPELASQDNQVVTVLGDGFRVEVNGDLLTVSASGGEGLIYRAEG